MFQKPIEIEYDYRLQRYKIKNTRLTLEFISELIESGWSVNDITKNYPQIDENKIAEIVRYKEKNYKKKNIRKVLDEIFSR